MNISLPLAEALAADLAGAQVDPNEAQKALAHLRSKGESKALFSYLQAVVNDGSAVIRSGRTLSYYRDLLAICQRHLRPLQGDYPQLLATFAWSLRLLRYYRAVPWASEEKSAERRGQPEAAPSPTKGPEQPVRPAAPALPAVGGGFTSKVLERGEKVIIFSVPGYTPEAVLATLEIAEDTPNWQVGNLARIEVVSVEERGGRTILRVRRAPKAKKS